MKFLVRGVVYQLYGKNRDRKGARPDPIADDRITELKRDLELFKELGLNTLFVFSIDNTKRHDVAMRLLAEAGIYVLVGLSTAKVAIKRSAPYDSYNTELLEEYFTTIDCLAPYNNTLGVLVGNEVINTPASTPAGPVIRAVTRDIKRYMSIAAEVSGQRRLPVGYSSADVVQLLQSTFEYLTAGDPDEAIDFFGFNNYSWAGKASIEISGYKWRIKQFSETHVPVFFSEYGTQTGSPRIFQETSAIYSPDMTHVFSGGIVYEFWMGVNGYGLVATETTEDGQTKIIKLEDYENLRERLNESTAEPNTIARWADAKVVTETVRKLPEASSTCNAVQSLPASPLDWDGVCDRLEMREWVDVKQEMDTETVDELASAMKTQLKLSDETPANPDRQQEQTDIVADKVEAKMNVFHDIWN